MEKVIFKKEVLEYLDKLIFNLFSKEYFSFEENAHNYVDKIVNFILEEITNFPHKKSPKSLNYLGSHYIFYKAKKKRPGMSFLKNGINNF